MSNRKVMLSLLTVGLIKKILLYKLSYLPETRARNKNRIKVELELSNYAAKSDLKKALDVDTSNLLKADLASLRSEID